MTNQLSNHHDARVCRANRFFEPLEDRKLFAVSLGSDGWTDVTPSADTRIVYVSSSGGSDSNGGLSSGSPVRTLAKARSLVRDGSPDWMLLKRGDTWTENLSSWTQSGRNEEEPILISSYGTSAARPLLKTGTSIGFSNKDQVSHLAIIGLSFHSHTRDTDSSSYSGTTSGNHGFQSLGRMNDVLVEDVVFDDYRGNVSITGYDATITNFTLRRSIITDSWSLDGSSAGIYVHKADDVKIEENVLDHNGWNESEVGQTSNVPSHGIYMSSGNGDDIIIRGNVISNSGSHGVQARSGGIIENNLLLRNPINLLFGGGSPTVKAGGVAGRVTGNVILDSRDIDGSKRGTGMEFSNLRPGANIVVADNIMTADTQRNMSAITFGTTPDATNASESKGINDVTFRDNIVYDWHVAWNMPSDFKPGGTGRLSVNNLKVQNNDFQFASDSRLVRNGPGASGELAWSGNRYANFADNSPSGWFLNKSVNTSFNTWRTNVESSAQSTVVDYADPERSIGTYGASIGKSATLSSFTGGARSRPAGAMDGRFTAAAVINHVRKGFAEDGVVPGGLLSVPSSGSTPGGTADTTAPTAPSGLAVTAATASSVSLTWNGSTDNVGVSGYYVFRNGTRVGTTSGRTYTDSGLTASTSYTYTVKAIDAAANSSAASNTATGTTISAEPTHVPSAPTSLTAAVQSDRSVKLTWTDKSSMEAGFYIYTSTNGSTWTKLATAPAKSSTGTSTSFTTGTMATGTRYFRVSAFNGLGESAKTSSVKVTI